MIPTIFSNSLVNAQITDYEHDSINRGCKIKFSESKQAFYETDFNYPQLPEDLVPVKDRELHLLLVDKINSGCRVFSDLTLSTRRPSIHHEWINNQWTDPRTPEQRESDVTNSLRPLTRRQFKLTLHQYGMLSTIEQKIASVPDANLRTLLQIEYEEATEFSRSSSSVLAMIQILGLSTAQVNTMWQWGLTQ